MKAAQLVSPREFDILDVPMPTVQPGEVLVHMEHVSVCGSDLRTYDRVLGEADYPLKVGVPCHECLGVVEESRSDALKPGQRVIAVTNVGGLVEYLALSDVLCVPVPEAADNSLWVLCQPAGTVVYAVQQMGSVLGKRVVVLGQGPIGVVFTDLLVRGGATQVIVTDLHDYRLEQARRVGATHTINAARENVVEAVAEITGGAMADIAVEACGRPEAAHQVFQTLRLEGLAIIFGLAHTDDVFPFNWQAMYDKLPRVIVTNSARAGNRVESVRTCVDLVAQGRLNFSYLVTHRLPFSEIQQAYDLYSAKTHSAMKVVIAV
jgi:threonine dehydrogenase-like Zn-dependent dehydrogenase